LFGVKSGADIFGEGMRRDKGESSVNLYGIENVGPPLSPDRARVMNAVSGAMGPSVRLLKKRDSLAQDQQARQYVLFNFHNSLADALR